MCRVTKFIARDSKAVEKTADKNIYGILCDISNELFDGWGEVDEVKRVFNFKLNFIFQKF